MTSAVDAARANLDRMRFFLCTPTRQSETYAEHMRIVAALSARQPEEAAAAMRDHLDLVMAELEGFAKTQPDLVAPDRAAN